MGERAISREYREIQINKKDGSWKWKKMSMSALENRT
jgi:hypothetical protein